MKFIFRKTVSLALEVVFGFFQNPRCIEVLHGEAGNVRLLRHSGHVRPGGETWVEITGWYIMPIVLGFRHDRYDPPNLFHEHLIHGPFKTFEHLHEFRSLPEGTEIVDHIEITLPLHYGGEAAMQRLVAPAIEKSFQQRHERLDVLIADGTFQKCSRENRELKNLS